MKNILILLFLTLVVITNSQAQKEPKSFLYTNVTVHLGNGEVLKDGMVGVRDGKIDMVLPIHAKIALNYQVTIDGEGKHLYPSLIAPNTRLGLEEIEAVRASLDFTEVGNFNPNIRSIIAYNTDSEVVPTIRSNGILLAQIVPSGGRISGQSSIAYTEAENWEDAAFALDNCVHLQWPNRIRYTGWWAQKGDTEIDKQYNENLEAIRVYFDAAKAYAQKKTVDIKNLKFETMKLLFSKEKKLIVHVDNAKSMMDAVNILQAYGVEVVLQGANEAWKITDYLKEKNVAVILNNVHHLPKREDDDVYQPYKTPVLLQEKGIKFALAMEGSWNVRNLPFQAGQAVAFGLDKEAALRSITLSTAEILGIADRVGSIEEGKDATFIVSKGDILDMRSSVVVDAFILGRRVNLGDKQKDLYDKYMEKYELKKN